MNQPTEDRIKRLEEEQRQLREDVRILKQQQTEPIKLTIERRQYEVESTLEKHTELLKEQDDLLTKIYTDVGHAKADIGVLKHEMAGARADITAMKATQSDHGELLKTMATKEDLTSLEARIEARFDRLEAKILRRLPEPEGE